MMTVDFNAGLFDNGETKTVQQERKGIKKIFGALPPIEVTVSHRFNPAEIDEGIKPVLVVLDDMEEQVRTHAVDSDASHEKAVEMIGQARKVLNRTEDKRKEVKDPFFRAGKEIDARFNPIKARLTRMIQDLTTMCEPFLLEKERIRKEAQEKAEAEERRLREEAEREREAAIQKAQYEALAQCEDEGVPPEEIEERVQQAAEQAAEDVQTTIPMPAPVVPQETKTTTTHASATVKKKMVGKLVDPIAFLKANPNVMRDRWDFLVKALQPPINKMVAAEIETIPGVDVKEKSSMNVRAKG